MKPNSFKAKYLWWPSIINKLSEQQIIDDIIGENDVWILPTCPAGLAFDLNPNKGRIDIEQENGDMKATPYWPSVLTYVLPFTISGHPIVTMPIGKIGDLPLGVQVIGKRDGDDELLNVCRVLEDLCWWWEEGEEK